MNFDFSICGVGRVVFGATSDVDEVYNLAADMGGIGFIESHKALIMHNSVFINIHMLKAARRMHTSRAKELFGFHGRRTSREGLRKTVEWFLSNRQIYREPMLQGCGTHANGSVQELTCLPYIL